MMASNKKMTNDDKILVVSTASKKNKINFIDGDNNTDAGPSNSTIKGSMKRRLIEDESSSSSLVIPLTKKMNIEKEKEMIFKSAFDKVKEHQKTKLVGLTGLTIHYVNRFSDKFCERVDPTNQKSNIRLIKSTTQKVDDIKKTNLTSSPSPSQEQQNKRKGEDNQDEQPNNKKPRCMQIIKTSLSQLPATTKSSASPVLASWPQFKINSEEKEEISIAGNHSQIQTSFNENNLHRITSSYKGTEILLPNEDEETAIALASLLFHAQMRFLQPALMAFFQQNFASLIYPEETDRIDSFGFLRQLRTDEAFEKLRRTVNKSKLLSSAKEMDNGLRIVNALNSRNAVAHHDLAKIFRIWPQMLASWTDLIEITLENVQAAKKMQNIFLSTQIYFF